MYERHIVGKFGEETVEKYLQDSNYSIIRKNFHCRFGEIDIIAKDTQENELVFIEIKTRKNNLYGAPAESVNKLKKKHIFKTAEYYIYINKLEEKFIRIDVIEVYIKNGKTYINHIKQAF